MSAFVIQSRYVLLTYAQCGDLDGFTVMERISELGAECIIGRELHEDGGIHLHCFCDFGRKFRSRRADLFDVGGRHPNIEKVARTPAKAYDYAIKDGDVICGGLGRPVCPEGRTTTIDKWAEITSAENREEFWELVHRLDPKAAACSFTSLSKYCDWKFETHAPEYESPRGITFDEGEFDGRADWIRQSGLGLGEPLLGMCFRGDARRWAPQAGRPINGGSVTVGQWFGRKRPMPHLHSRFGGASADYV